MKRNILLFGLLGFVLIAGNAVRAATFTVNTTEDTVDANPGDGIAAIRLVLDCATLSLVTGVFESIGVWWERRQNGARFDRVDVAGVNAAIMIRSWPKRLNRPHPTCLMSNRDSRTSPASRVGIRTRLHSMNSWPRSCRNTPPI